MAQIMKVCGHCGQAVLGRCGPCTRDRYQRVDAHRGTSTQRGYTPEWRMLRLKAFLRDSWTCVDCGWKPDIVAQFHSFGIHSLPPTNSVIEELRVRKLNNQRHLHGDHILTIQKRPDLRLYLDNIATRCNVCHAIKTGTEDGGGWSSRN